MNKIKRIIPLIIILLMVTGCVKMSVTMDIKKDKSMTLGIIQAIDKSLIEESTSTTILTEEDKTKLKENDFAITDYIENEMIGYKITKQIKNIDKVSTKEEIITNLGTKELSENEYIFTIKKGIFKNTYKAKIKNSDIDEINNSLNLENKDNNEVNTKEENESEGDMQKLNDNLEFEEEIIDDENSLNNEDVVEESAVEEESNNLNNHDYSNLLPSMKLTMKVNLPYKAISNNATISENEGKTLTWDLINFKEEIIEFKFIIYNIPNIIITIVAIILLLILIILLLIKKKKDRNEVSTSKLTPIEYNQHTIIESNYLNKDIQSINITPMPKPIKLDSITNIKSMPEYSLSTEKEQNNQISQYDSILQENTDK